MSNLVYEGPVDPTITGSLGNIFKWKGFTLNVFMTYSFGNVVRLDPIFSNGYSDLTAMPREFANRYLNPGDERRTNVPVIALSLIHISPGRSRCRTARPRWDSVSFRQPTSFREIAATVTDSTDSTIIGP